MRPELMIFRAKKQTNRLKHQLLRLALQCDKKTTTLVQNLKR